MKSWYYHFLVPGIVPYSIFLVIFVFTEIEDVWNRLKQRPSQAVRPVIETTDTSGGESAINPRKRNFFSWKTYKMKKACDSNELARLFVTDPTDAVAKPSHFTVNSVGVMCLC